MKISRGAIFIRKKWARRDSNSRPPPCEGDVIKPAVSGLVVFNRVSDIPRTLRTDENTPRRRGGLIYFMIPAKGMRKD